MALQQNVTQERRLTRVEEIQLLASVVQVNTNLGLPPLDRDGEFLKVHDLDEYLIGLGQPDDDANNTFTGRLLLLLESRCVFGDEVYQSVLKSCIERYWIDYNDHADSFVPAFLLNDILRFWRTLCVNYEAGSSPLPEKRRTKNYKLKHSRLLTCFSAVLALQVEYGRQKTISPDRALELLRMTPIERIEFAKEFSRVDRSKFDRLLALYADFLQETDIPKGNLVEKMKGAEYYRKTLDDARKFGDVMYEILESAAKRSEGDISDWRFLRYITV